MSTGSGVDGASRGSASVSSSSTTPNEKKGKVMQTGEKKFGCPSCSKQFSRIENLTRHQATHEAIGRFQCQICQKRFSRSDLLNRHRKIHDNNTGSPHSDIVKKEEKDPSVLPQSLPSIPGTNSSWLLESSQDVQTYSHPLRGREYDSAYDVSNGYGGHTSEGSPYGRVDEFNSNSGLSMQQAYLDQQPLVDDSPEQPALTLPVIWNGFMADNPMPGLNAGSYDADIAWTFDVALSDIAMDFTYNNAWIPTDHHVHPIIYNQPQYQQHHQYQQMAPTPHLPPIQQVQPMPPIQPIQQHAISNQHVQQDIRPRVEVLATEEDVPNDWPDDIGNPGNPSSKPIRRKPLDPTLWQPIEDEAWRDSGKLCMTESFLGLREVDEASRTSYITALNLPPTSSVISAEVSATIFPSPAVLKYYLLLYFAHVHSRFPVLHLPTFQISRVPPLLQTAMMMAGSSHSSSDRGRFVSLFYDKLRIAVMKEIELDGKYLRTVDNLFTFLLLCHAGTWSGHKQAYEFAEGARGIIVTAGRRNRFLDGRPVPLKADMHGGDNLKARWFEWIEIERRRRLGMAIYVYDCQYPSLFNNQMYVSKAETTNCVFPCAPAYWEASSAEKWQALLGHDQLPPATAFLHALNCCLLRKWVKPAPPIAHTEEPGKIILIYALMTHIFEWRQAVSMLNPTGLMSAFGNSAHEMGKGLTERRRWLMDSLESFSECYVTEKTTTGAAIMHQLAYVSLNISLSDLHLAAGRLGSRDDRELAKFALRSWANSEGVEETLEHVMTMLTLAHDALRDGSVMDSSCEVAGGLVCWAYTKLRDGPRGSSDKIYADQVGLAAKGLKTMGCWRLSLMFGSILEKFQDLKRSR